MTTKSFLITSLLVLILLGGVAMIWRPDDIPADKTPLVWVSDNNPSRTLQISAFNEEHPDFLLSLDYGNSGVQKIILQCASGVGPDIFDYGDEDMGTYVESGVLWDVTEASEKLGFNADKDGWPASKNTYTYNGRQYGFPCNTGAPILMYNKNVFDYLGLPYPEGLMSWEDFVVLGNKINDLVQEKTGGKSRLFPITGANWRIFFDSQHGEYFSEDGMPNLANSPALQKAFEWHRDFIFNHRFMPSSVEAKAMSGQGGFGAGNLNQFAGNRFSMIVTGYWSLAVFSRVHQQQMGYLEKQGIKVEDIKNPLERPIRVGAVMIPNFQGLPPSYRVQSRVAGINARSPRREEALQFLQYLAGPTYSEILNEGMDWLPGNPEYANLGIQPGSDDLQRPALQKLTEEAMAHGFSPRRSPFVLATDVNRVLTEQISRLESNPEIPVESLLQSAQANLLVLLRRNLERNPTLKDLFIQRLGEDAYKNLK